MSDNKISKAEQSTGALRSTGLAQMMSNLKSRVTDLIAAHGSRVVSLRVYSAKRSDGLATAPGSKRPAAASCDSATVTSSRNRDAGAGFLTRMKKRIISLYREHEFRVAALRVYSGKRVDCSEK